MREEGFSEEKSADERRSEKHRKKKRAKPSTLQLQLQQQQHGDASPVPKTQGGGVDSSGDTLMSGPGEDEWEEDAAAGEDSCTERSSGATSAEDHDGEYRGKEESSIFGETTGASNATWVECDRCKKVR